MPHRSIAAGLIVLCGLVLASCGARPVGWGVVLWGETSGAPRTGSIVGILQESAIGEASLIAVPGEKKPREYPLGRIRIFKKKSEATAFAAAYAGSTGAWAVVVKEDLPPLPVRDAPGQDGKVIYKLQYGQLVKVVSRSAEKVDVKPYSDYWYEVTTEDGFTGWCFGHFLKPFTSGTDPAADARKVLSQDDVLARIMGTTWRPSWFLDQVARGAIDLSMYREDVGFFPDPQDHVMKLVLPLSTFEFHYTGEPQKAGVASYTFPGTDLRVDVLDQDRITVSYRYKDQPKTDLYVTVKDDVAQIISAEQARRSDLYAALLKRGATLSSSAYGTIHLQQGMRFTWEGFSKLVPTVIGPDAKGGGSVDFSLHVGKELASDYDGVITFVFDEYPRAGVSFLYRAAGGGLRFTSLGRDSLQDLFVTHPGLSAVVIFFNQS
ncbi:MAG TPA: SH3 domain-containing protein [Spirochaetia bacterium]|nr:SH3 domain-containing protein [Spirochaetia bacterium]